MSAGKRRAGPAKSGHTVGRTVAYLAVAVLVLAGIALLYHLLNGPKTPPSTGLGTEPAGVSPSSSSSIKTAAPKPTPAISQPSGVPMVPASSPAPAGVDTPVVGPPPPPAAPNFAPRAYSAVHEKTFGTECSGTLTLGPTELSFVCPENSRESFAFRADEVERVDRNGVVAQGHKYHFRLGGQRAAGADIFTAWFASTHVAGANGQR